MLNDTFSVIFKHHVVKVVPFSAENQSKNGSVNGDHGGNKGQRGGFRGGNIGGRGGNRRNNLSDEEVINLRVKSNLWDAHVASKQL